MRMCICLVGLAILAAGGVTLAQDMPHPHDHDGHGIELRGDVGGGPGDGPGGANGGPDGGPPHGPPPDGGPDGPGGGPMGGPNGGPGQAGPRRSVGAMTSYIDLVDRYTKLSDNVSAASVSAVVSLTEVLRPKGPEAVIEELNKLLPRTKDATVIRAIRLQLIDFYRAANQPEKAIEQAEILVTSSSATTQPS